MSDAPWQPGASLDVIKQSAALRACIRDYMQQHTVLEVVTPALSSAGSTDPNIHSFRAGNYYLHTSPEFPMKRLLAAYACDIYQIATVFRDGESGRNHNAEFSLLEWYRVGSDHLKLIDDVLALLQRVAQQFNRRCPAPNIIRYTEIVATLCEKSFQDVCVADVKKVFLHHNRSYPDAIGNDLDAALDLLIDEFVVAEFEPDQITVMLDYPASQASLARVSVNARQIPIAERFEIYWGRLELANGFHELSDSAEQRARFEKDQRIRRARGQQSVPMDEHLLQALASGLPDCAGVALGLDRLLMVLSNQQSIDQVLAFSTERA